MRSFFLAVVLVLSLVCFKQAASAQEVTLPAGTLLNCTLDEPNFSTFSAQVGDPVICNARGVQQFGRAVFPRGTYLAGHLADAKDPGHFWGKGWLKLEFDRISLPDTELPVPGKLVAVRGYRVDREGKIIGHGHPRRDVIEWLIPPLWPWKLVSLPARGPRPALKGETQVTLRLMEDVAVPTAVTTSRAASAESIPATKRSPAQLTLIALKGEVIYAAADYWMEAGRLYYVLQSGAEGAFDPMEVDWSRTAQLNAERGITVTLRNRPRVH
jgi:hypothetical protein